MKRARLGLLAFIMLICVSVAEPGLAARTRIGIASATSSKECEAGAGSACSGAVSGFRNGALAVDTAITSPLNGLLPGQGDNYGAAQVKGTYSLRRAVRSLPVTATVRVDSASARHTGVLFGTDPKGSETGFAGAAVVLRAMYSQCSSDPYGWNCWGQSLYVRRQLVDATGPTSLGRTTITLRGVLRPGFGPPEISPGAMSALRPGRIDISVALYGATRLGGCANPMCYGPELPPDCTYDQGGCVVRMLFPSGCVDPSCAVPVPYGCVDPDCNVSFPPYGCLDPDCNVWYPPGMCLEGVCIGNLYCTLSPWCLAPVTLPVENQLADTGVARAAARGVVTGLWVG